MVYGGDGTGSGSETPPAGPLGPPPGNPWQPWEPPPSQPSTGSRLQEAVGGRRNFTILIVAACIVLAGAIAGISIAVAGGGGGLAASYLARESGPIPGVIRLSFAPSGGSNYFVTVDETDESGSPPDASLSTNTFTGTASLDGSTVVFNIPGQGTDTFLVKGGDLVHDGVSSSGSPTAISYHPASTAQWHRALAQLSTKLKNENAVAQAQQNVAQEQSGIQAAAQTVNSDIQTVNQDASTVQQDMATFNSDYAAFSSDAQNVAQDQQELSGPNFTCGSSWQGDYYTLNGQISTLQEDANSASNDLQTLSGDLGTLAKHLKTYESLQASDASYTPHGAPTPASVDAEINSVGQAGTGAVNTVNSDVSKVNSTASADYQALASANASQSCGNPGSPTVMHPIQPFVYPSVPSSSAG